ncbi:hypothetical protein STAS_04076 [Striga asiatica]|uniref:Neprosin PEP catalytic domain-containing protein n=1 Tax=Striga asiatica TaxID=4170 RepID=A0A5A7P6A9_STRAF|nr:hypothetical protein STAS_04076 [Striga asiatica]
MNPSDTLPLFGYDSQLFNMNAPGINRFISNKVKSNSNRTDTKGTCLGSRLLSEVARTTAAERKVAGGRGAQGQPSAVGNRVALGICCSWSGLLTAAVVGRRRGFAMGGSLREGLVAGGSTLTNVDVPRLRFSARLGRRRICNGFFVREVQLCREGKRGLWADAPPYGIDYPSHRPTVHFSNRRNIPDISEHMGSEPTLPYLSPQLRGPRLRVGANCASVGVGVLNDTGIQLVNVIRIYQQLDYFKKYQRRLRALIGEEEAERLVAESLTLITLGGNDFVNYYYLVPYSARSRQFTLENYVPFVISEYEKIIAGCVPAELALHSRNGGCAEELQKATQLLNPQLKRFITSKIACCGQGPYNGLGLCTPLSNLCPNRDLYVFWDPLHPSERANRIIVQRILRGSEEYMKPMNLKHHYGFGLKGFENVIGFWNNLNYTKHNSHLSSWRIARIKRRLDKINKPPVVAIESPDGDIIDCIRKRKQLAMDHPILKNHKIQSIPPKMPKATKVDGANTTKRADGHKRLWQMWHQTCRSCPNGTVPVRRITVHDVLRAKSLYRFGKKRAFRAPSHANYTRLTGENNHISVANSHNSHEYAVAYTTFPEGIYGAKAGINLWDPTVKSPYEFSLSQIWVAAGSYHNLDLNTVEAGWHVDPQLYGDNRPRLFTFWTKDAYQSTGCYNLLCSGFVQVSNQILVGGAISPFSTLGGPLYEIVITIFKDPEKGNWWLALGDKPVGYWPSELFSHLSDRATVIEWGGEIVNLRAQNQHTATDMGSGHFAEAGYGKASYFRNLESPDGDIIDCIHITEQPAMDHPLLKNHTIQSIPPEMPKATKLEGTNTTKSADGHNRTWQMWHQTGHSCPNGTVPVRRITVHDVLRAKSLYHFGNKRTHIFNRNSHEHAVAYTKSSEGIYGAKAGINLWGPSVESKGEFSLSQIWVMAASFGTDLNSIESGWQVQFRLSINRTAAYAFEQVDPQMYGDNRPRFFTYWTKDAYQTTGCYNLLCPGFVQVTKQIVVGGAISPVSNDPKKENWWVSVGDKPVGYWPSTLFNLLSDRATMVEWGGYFAESGYGKASYFRNLEIVDYENSLGQVQKDAYQTTGCYNLLCPGFVQVDKKILIGAAISPFSTVGGSQFEVVISIFKDIKNGNWWLAVGDTPVGYWPTALFTHLSDRATMVEWGGEIVNKRANNQHTSTQMGSGHLAEDGFGKASYFRNLEIMDQYNNLGSAQGVTTSAESPNCYNIKTFANKNWGTHFYYGGPGRSPQCP